MPRLPRINPFNPVSVPLAPASTLNPATGRGSPNPGRTTTPFVFLAALANDPTDLPDDGVCRMWFRDDLGQIRVAIGGTKYKLNVTAV